MVWIFARRPASSPQCPVHIAQLNLATATVSILHKTYAVIHSERRAQSLTAVQQGVATVTLYIQIPFRMSPDGVCQVRQIA